VTLTGLYTSLRCLFAKIPVDGWDRAPTRRLWVEGYQARSFDCELGSHFHHGYVFEGPPIMPDGRISQVRFEVLASRL